MEITTPSDYRKGITPVNDTLGVSSGDLANLMKCVIGNIEKELGSSTDGFAEVEITDLQKSHMYHVVPGGFDNTIDGNTKSLAYRMETNAVRHAIDEALRAYIDVGFYVYPKITIGHFMSTGRRFYRALGSVMVSLKPLPGQTARGEYPGTFCRIAGRGDNMPTFSNHRTMSDLDKDPAYRHLRQYVEDWDEASPLPGHALNMLSTVLLEHAAPAYVRGLPFNSRLEIISWQGCLARPDDEGMAGGEVTFDLTTWAENAPHYIRFTAPAIDILRYYVQHC